MIVIDDNNVVVARQIFTVVREQIVATARRISASVHVNHNRAFSMAMNLRGPDIHA
jgi:hypothetical protein